MLRHIYPAIQHMPKGERMDGVGADLKRAALAIIREEATDFFGGMRNAQQCAENIQNRVSIYLSEQS